MANLTGVSQGHVDDAHQPYGKQSKVAPSTFAALAAIRADRSIPDKERADRMFDALRKNQPELVTETRNLVRRAEQGFAEFKSMLTDIAGRLNFKPHHDIEDPKMAMDMSTGHVIPGPVKTLSRSAVKIATKYDGDVTQLKDVLRGSIAVRDDVDLVNTLAELERVSGGKIWRDDRITKPLDTGYRDYQVLIQTPSGVLAEILIITKPMLRAKQIGHDQYYVPWQGMVKTTPEAQHLLKKQQELYGPAWQVSDPHNRLAGLLKP